MTSHELVWGPHDGGKVVEVGGHIPDVIFVKRKPLGDGFVAYGLERSDRFPLAYVRQHDGRFWLEYELQGLICENEAKQ